MVMTEDHELKMLWILLVYTSEIVWSWCGRYIHVEFDSTNIVIKAEERDEICTYFLLLPVIIN